MKSFYRELIKTGKDIKTFSEEIQVTTQTIYSWKSGKSKPKTRHMHKMAKILNIDIDKIIDDFYQ